MNKLFKRLTAIALILCCIISAAGVNAPVFAYGGIDDELSRYFGDGPSGAVKITFADHSVFCGSLTQALEGVKTIAANSRGTYNTRWFDIQLQRDITETVYFTDINSSEYSIDLNGYTWTAKDAGCLQVVGSWDGTSISLSSSKPLGKMVGGSGFTSEGESCGGCIFAYGSSLTVGGGIRFSNSNKDLYAGGAIYADDVFRKGCSVVIRGSEFERCIAGIGGAVFVKNCDLDILGGIFNGCSADCGGGVYLNDANAVFSITRFMNCSATEGGGIACFGYNGTSQLTLKNTARITNCTADQGGGLYLFGDVKADMTDEASIDNCVAGEGGGIYLDGLSASLSLSDNTAIYSCSAVNNSPYLGYGGAIYMLSGYLTQSGNSKITTCTADGRGSAIFLANGGGSIQLTENTSITECSGYGISVNSGQATISSGTYKTDFYREPSGQIIVQGGWFSKKVSYPASGLYATNEVPGAPDNTAPYSVAEKVVKAQFYGNNGTQSYTAFSDLPAGGIQIPVCSYTKADCSFAGWAIGSPSGDVVQEGDYYDLQQDTVFYATWTPGANAARTIKFIDPVSSESYSMTVNSRTVKAEALSTRFKRDNYHISGYNTQKDGNGTAVPAGSVVDLGNQLELTLYVMWDGNLNINGGDGSGVYTVTFTDSTSSSRNADYVFKSQNTSMILMDNGFVRTGEVLGGWATMPNGWGTIYQLGDRYTFPSPNSTLYAYWVSKDVDTYHAGESGKSSATEIVINVDPNKSESKEDNEGSSKESKFNTIVFYDPTGQNKPVTLKTYDSSTMIYAGGFKRSGYSLGGWNTQANGRGIDYKNGEEYRFGNSRELVLYAMWMINGNNIIEGESGKGASQEIIDAYKNNEKPSSDWKPSGGEGGTIGNIPSDWREEYGDRPYYDVEKGKYYYDAVIWADKEGAISGIIGIDADLFNPESPCTRADMVTLLWEVAGEPKPKNSKSQFTDVPAGTYYSQAVAWGAEQGIIQGIGNNKMDPEGIVTRSQALTFLWRYHGSPAAGSTTDFTDLVKGSWYETAVKWGVSKDITNGTSVGKFSPEQICSRGEIVTFLFRDFAGEH